MSFSDLSLISPLLRALGEEGYVAPTPIQAQAIPHVLAGRDLLGLAQTGTGKTAAFALPVLQRLTQTTAPRRPGDPRPVRALVVTPTRELASQIAESFAAYGRHLDLTAAVIFGGVSARPQEAALKRGVDILVATPGRLLDHMRSKLARFDALEVFVLDEADRMLDMGFLPDVKRIIAALPKVRQNLFFSATMPPEVRSLSASLLTRPAEVAVAPPATTVERVTQGVYHVPAADKRRLLVSLLGDRALARVLVFTRTKSGANRLVKYLDGWNLDAAVIHGGKSQGARERALGGFKDGGVRVLVATDIAARGIDVDGVTHVINYDLPNVPEAYVHRIGRTARAGAAGAAIAFCSPDERPFLRDIEKAIRQVLPPLTLPDLGFDLDPPEPRTTSARASVAPPAPRGKASGGRGAPRGGSSSPSRGPAPPKRGPSAAPARGTAPPPKRANPAPAPPQAGHRAPSAAPAAPAPNFRRAPGERLSGDLVTRARRDPS